MAEPSAAELAFVEDVAAFYAVDGLPRTVGRVLGWLLVCDPPEQTAAQLAMVLRASRGTISGATRTLVTAGLVRRSGRPGERVDYFSVRADLWSDLVERRMLAATRFHALVRRGLELLDDAPAGRRERLAELDRLYRYLEVELHR